MTTGPGGPRTPRRFARDLAARLTDLLGDVDTARVMGDHGRLRVEERFSWASIAAETAALYRRLLS